MKNLKLTDFITPALTILGGLVLVFSPDTATKLLSATLGWVALAVGVILVIVALAAKQLKGVIQGGISAAVGLWLKNNPMSLAVAFGKILGICLVLGAVSGYGKSNSPTGRIIYVAEGLLGLVLLMVPLAASRAVYTVIGLILLAAGIVMLVNKLRNQNRLGGGGNIIDV